MLASHSQKQPVVNVVVSKHKQIDVPFHFAGVLFQDENGSLLHENHQLFLYLLCTSQYHDTALHDHNPTSASLIASSVV